MNTKQLRQKILDLAIRGKLVPQDPNDEPASALLQRIRDERRDAARHVSKTKPDKQDASSDKSPYQNLPFEVPDGWGFVTLREVCEIFGRIGFRGYTREDLVSDKEGVITLSPSNIIGGKMNYDKCTFISWFKYEESPEIKIFDSDILVVKTGSSYGKCALVENLPKEATINPQFVVLKNIKCDKNYLNYVLSSCYARKCFDNFVLGTAIPTFTQKNLANLLFPLPPLAEQHRIVSVIESAFALIDEIEESKTSLEQIIKQAKAKTLELAIKGKLCTDTACRVPTVSTADNSPYTDLPDGWKNVKLEEVCNVKMGQSPDGQSISNDTSGVEFHQGKICFSDKFLKESNVYTSKPSKIAEKNSLLLCVRAPVGVVNITERRICIGRGLCAINPKQEVDLMFVYYWLQTMEQEFNEKATGTTFKAISGDIIKSSAIPLPPLPVQHQIVLNIEDIFGELAKIEEAVRN